MIQTAPFGSAPFARVWLASVVSGFGDEISLIALAYVSWQLTSSALFTSLAIVITTVPNALFGIFAGAVADALGHRRAMISSDLLRCILVGAIAPLLALGAPLAIAYALVFVSATLASISRPARLSLVPDLLPPGGLGAGNSLMLSSDRVVKIVGALVAGGVVALLGQGAFYVDAITFGVSALLLAGISGPLAPRRALAPASLWREAVTGLRFIRASAVLWANTRFSLAAQLAIPVFNSLAPVLVFRDYGFGATEFAILEASIAAGAVLAAFALPRALGRFRKGRVMIFGFAFNGLVLMLIAFRPPFEVLLALGALSGVSNILFVVPNVTILQEASPPELRARVFGARIALLNLSWLPMIVLSGTLADQVGAATLVAAAGAITVVAAAGAALTPIIRDSG